MIEILSAKLIIYMQDNNPELLHRLHGEKLLREYIHQKLVAIDHVLQDLLIQERSRYLIEELCMELLTVDLSPSKYAYIRDVLEEDFFIEYHYLLRSGILMFEITNLIEACNHLFEAFAFSEENADDKNLRYAIAGTIREYFEESEKGNSGIWLITPSIN